MLLPLVRINVDPSAPVADYLPLRIVLPETVVGGGNVSETAAGGLDWKALLYGLYAAGFTVVLISAAVSLGRIRKVIRQYKGVRYCYDGKRYVMLHIAEHDLPSFSFMNHVVISRSDNGGHPEILTHECAHAGHHHSADMLFMSLVCAFQWFNPLVWMMLSELRMMHEYEADEAVLKQGIDATQYQLLLVRKAVGDSRFLIANSFGHSKLKNRIAMIGKVKTTKWAALAYVACLPLLLAAMSFNATDGGNDVMSGTDDLVDVAEPVVAGPESAVDTLDDKVYGYSELEVRPKFNGGDVNEFSKWVSARLVYPKDARDAGKEGRVYVQFTINRDGSVSDISLMEGICESIDNEVIRVVSESPDWTPGYIDGKPVNVTYAFPVIFRL